MNPHHLRIGVVVPSSNTTIEPEWHSLAPAGVSVHSTRVFQAETDRSDEKIATVLAMNAELEGAIARLVSVEPGTIAFGCTAASFLRGAAYDRELCDRLSGVAGVPFVTASTAVVTALGALGASRVALGTPYIDAVNELERRYLEDALEVEVVAVHGLQIVGNVPKGRLPPSAAYEVARQVDRPEAEAVFLSCTNWSTIGVIDRLERELGKPVITSNQATLWAALRLGGVEERLSGYGGLFELSAPRGALA